MDPLTKKYPELTPYQFASDDPIANIDIDGLEGAKAIAKDLPKKSEPGVLEQAVKTASNWFKEWINEKPAVLKQVSKKEPLILFLM